MRETFTSGSSRGEWAAPFVESPSLLLYRYADTPLSVEWGFTTLSKRWR